MGVTNVEKFDNASTAFRAAYDEFFAGGPPSTADMITDKIPNDQAFYELDVLAAFPRVREWLGPKQFKDLRAYKQTIEVTSYEISHEIPRRDILYKSSGQIAKGIRTFMEQGRFFYDDLLYTAFLANTWTGYDGSALLADAHANTNSTGDNLGTAALSQAALDAGVQAMEDLQGEDGRHLGTFPTHLYVGPAQRKVAFDLTGSDRPRAIANTGLEAAASVIHENIVPNYLGGALEVVVTPWITGNEWCIVDASKAGKPFVLVENRAPEGIDQTDMSDEARFLLDVFRYSVEADAAVAAGLWQTIYGSVS